MAFVLKVTAGPGRGTEYAFGTGQEAKLGRTADNDVVVKDAAASRSHARVFEKKGRHYVEDLGSANGTNVNSEPIDGVTELRRGDSISIGDVVLAFSLAAAAPPRRANPDATVDEESAQLESEEGESDDSEADGTGDEESDADGTPIREQALARRPPVRRPPRPQTDLHASLNVEDDEPAEEAEAPVSGEYQAPEDEPADEPEPEPEPEAELDAGPPARRPPSRSNQPAVRPGRGASASENVAMSAADRARLRRQMQQSSSGRLQLMWEDLPRAARAGLILVLVLMGAGSVGLLVWVVSPTKTVNHVEPMELQANGATLTDSFGSGDVTFRTSDQKTFTFTTESPTRVIGVLHYQAKGIQRDEVAISLNGADLGTVPPDTTDADTRELDLVLPSTQLKKSEEGNTLTFDNTLNPPSDDPWKVWNIWVEIIPVPDMSDDEAARRAQEEIDRAQALAERREIGSENLFLAWKTYREAWLLLESTPHHSAEMEDIARSRMRELRPQLDAKCNNIIIEVRKALNVKSEDLTRARAILENVPRSFPSREHPCLSFSKSLLHDLDSEELETTP